MAWPRTERNQHRQNRGELGTGSLKGDLEGHSRHFGFYPECDGKPSKALSPGGYVP